MALQIAILGPVEPRISGQVVGVPAGKQRALLTLLAVRVPRPVSAECAGEALWPRAAPAEALRSLQVTVSRLRRSLGAAGPALETVASGYRLALEHDAIDSRRFETLVNEAQRLHVAGDAATARRLLDDALGMWRGPALADVAYESFAQAEIARLDELRLAALEQRIDVRLAQGEHALVVAELEQLSAEHPSRERLVGLLMLALYRCDRQADALAVYRKGRQRLVEELALEPSAALRDVERAILIQSDELAAPAALDASGELGLPILPNRTIAREHELAALAERLPTRSVRLVTLTGPGGVGKTRLALEAARAVAPEFPDGARFVSLAAVQRSGDVAAEIVKTLRIIVLSGESPERAVVRFLAAKQLLLVTDNFEHLVAAAPFISGLLGSCPGLTVLATSREPLALQAEERYPVEGLAGADAVELFCERARAHDPGFDGGDGDATAVAEICGRVDGLPLGIELAAARCAFLPPAEIAERLDAALAAPGAGARDSPARQQTLRATIDWSHELLSDDEKACFARFAVFAGGVTTEAAEAITGAELHTLAGLLAKSLVVRGRDAHTPTRLGMLDTIHAYASERFAASADVKAVRERHYRYYLALAQRHGSDRALWSAGGTEHLATLDADIDNLHAALGWAIAQANTEGALALAVALGRYWIMRSRWADAVDWVEQALNLPGADAHPVLRVYALRTKATCLWPLGRGAEQCADVAAAEAIARRLGDPVILAQALQSRVHHELEAGRLDVADAIADEALHCARAAGDDWEIAEASYRKALAAPSIPDLRERVDTAAALLSDVGNVHELAKLLADAAYAALCRDSEGDAKDFAARATRVARGLHSPDVRLINSGNFGLAALLTGETDTASRAFREELTLGREMVVRPAVFEGLRGLAAVAVVGGDDKRAATLVGAAAAHRYGLPEDRVEVRLNETFFEPARARCGTDAWNAATRVGMLLSFEEAIAYALEEPHARIHAHREAAT